jgi:hypothetical protein
MNVAQPQPANAARITPTGSITPSHGSVRRTTPASANVGQMRCRGFGLWNAATLSGPRNSIATAVPTGMRSIADRKAMVTMPVAIPSATTAPTSERVRPCTRGRLIAMKMTAPAVSPSHAVPAAPTVANRRVESADPTWTESIATAASVHARARSDSP